MAKYDVKYSCGHEERIELYGPTKNRESKIEWLERNGLCPNCYLAEQNKARAKMTAEAADKAKALNLPKLVGTEKQISWAETIRAKKINEFKEAAEKNQKMLDKLNGITAEQEATFILEIGKDVYEKQLNERKTEAKRNIKQYEDAKAQTSASWWIDNRA